MISSLEKKVFEMVLWHAIIRIFEFVGKTFSQNLKRD